MSGRGQSEDRTPELKLVLQAMARGNVDTIITVASELKITWRDAMKMFPPEFEEQAEQTIRRIENARAKKGKGAGNYDNRRR